jgi:hypothetical protein
MSSGSLFGSLTAIFIVGGVWLALGVVLVKLEQYANTMDLPQDAYNVITILNVAWWAALVIFLVLVVINHWLNSKDDALIGRV